MADISITATSVLKSTGQAIASVFGATITAGQAIYIDSTVNPSQMKLTDSNGAAAARACNGIALCGGSAGQPGFYCGSDPAFVTGGTLTSGDTIYASQTPGGLTAAYADISSASTVIVLGIVNTNLTLNLSPVIGGVK